MFKVIPGLLAVFLAAVFTSAHAQEPVLSPVMDAVRADQWDLAHTRARAIGPVAEDIVMWRKLRAGEGTFAQYVGFLDRRSDWPGLEKLRSRGEGVIPVNADAKGVLAFFDSHTPVTGRGAVRLVQAYRGLDRLADATAQAVLTWRSLPLSASDHAWLLDQYGKVLKGHHTARLDAMLWRGAHGSARLMLPLVPEGWRTLAVARMALKDRGPGVDALIAAVPDELADDAGLGWARFDWRRAKRRHEDAIALMDERSISAESLGQPDRWASWRRSYARRMMREGKPELAYRLAAHNYLLEGSSYADLEWLAGFIALRQLNEPNVALAHFKRFRAAVFTPISLGRAGYWEGRAYEAMGQTEQAQAAYKLAAKHQTSFYGQLAAEKAGVAMDAALIGTETYPDWRPIWQGNSLIRAAELFHNAQERNLAEWFLTHATETADAQGQAALAGLALEWGEHHIALRIAKVAARSENILVQAYFPLTGLEDKKHVVDDALVLSIARRESEFDPAVTSPAGARGLMQLMPGTAKLVAGDLGLEYRPQGLLSDPAYNATLGASYLKGLIDSFGQNYVLVSAGYNAGPGRPRQWMRDRGDPRQAQIDAIDWIEMIPFRETRNYVMRVSESIPVYRARLTGKTAPLRLSKEIKAK